MIVVRQDVRDILADKNHYSAYFRNSNLYFNLVNRTKMSLISGLNMICGTPCVSEYLILIGQICDIHDNGDVPYSL